MTSIAEQPSMTPIEGLAEVMENTFPQASVSLTAPLHQDGVWFMDIVLDAKHLVVQWSSGTGFGVSHIAHQEGYGLGPDEAYPSLDAAGSHIMKYLNVP